MYKDVKKKLLSVALCICMIIGMVQVVPKAKADTAVDATGKNVPIEGTNPLGVAEKCTLVIESSNLSYTGGKQAPSVSYANDASGNKISGSENWKLTVSDNDDGTIVGNHKCFLQKGTTGNYSFDPNDTTFTYTISLAKITDYNIVKKSNDVPWKSEGAEPALESVSVQLNGKEWLPLTKDVHYRVTSNLGTGRKTSTLTIIDANIDTANSVPPSPITYTVGYPLNGTIDGKTTEREMGIYEPSKSYTGAVHSPRIRIKDKDGWTLDVSQHPAEFANNFTVKYFKKNLQDGYDEIKASEVLGVGEYRVTVTANEGSGQLGSYWYTGTFTGDYTITAKDNSTLRVIADDVQNKEKAVTIYENGAQKKPVLVYEYAGGAPVKLENLQVWDGDSNVTNQFEQTYIGETGVGNANLTLSPIRNQSNYGSPIYIDYYITSEIEIVGMEFLGYDPGVTDIFYNGKPIIPKTYRVVNKNGESIDYDVSYGYQKDGNWYRTTDPNDPELAKTGSKRLYAKGKGNYASAPEVYKEYSVSAVDMSEGSKYYNDFTLELDSSDVSGTLQNGYYVYYNGEPREPRTVLKYGSGTNPKTELTAGTDYRVDYSPDNHSNKGNVTVTVTALPNGNYTGSRSVTFNILPVDLDKAIVEGDAGGDGFSYTGKAIVPKIVLKDGSNYTYELKDGDYEAEYYDVDNKETLTDAPRNVGRYQITLTNRNSNINGQTKTLTYGIVKRDISKDPDSMFTLSGVNGDDREMEWTGGATDPEVMCGSMVKGTDFTVSYSNDKTPGPVSGAAVTITGIGNYTGIKTLRYTITERSLGNQNMEADVFVDALAGGGYSATIRVEDTGAFANGYVLQQPSDYTIKSVTYTTDKKDTTDYKDSLTHLPKAGAYKAVLTGTGKYKDEKTVIIGCGYDISDAQIKISDPIATYTGNPITPSGITLEYRDEDGKKNSVDYVDGANSPFFIEFDRDDTTRTNANISAGQVSVYAVGNPAYGFYGTTATPAAFTIEALDIHSNKSLFEIEITDTRGTDINGTYTVPYLNVPWKDLDFIVRDADTGSIELKKKTDYTYSYAGDCTAQGSYEIVVTGTGNYTGTIKKGFDVGQTSIDHPNIKLKWTGNSSSSYAEGQPEPVLTLGSYDLVKGVDKDYTYSVSRIASPSSIGWNNCYKYVINGKNNFRGSRTEYYIMDQTQFDAATSLESWAPGQVYINQWSMDELMLDPSHIVQKTPKKFTLSYKKADGNLKTLEEGQDFRIVRYAQNNHPGTEGNEIILQGINGYSDNEVTFPVTLYTDIALAQFNNGSTIVSGGSISLTQLQDAIKTEDGLKNLVSLKNLWSDEQGGRIDPANYTVTFADSGYTPVIGTVNFIISGTQQAPRYYGGSMQVSMNVTGALNTDTVRIEVGNKNTVEWKGEEITPANTSFEVYDGNTRLKGGLATDADKSGYDYTIWFKGTEIGLCTATITGINRYAGEMTQDFKITYPMSKLAVKLKDESGDWKVYDGGSLSYLYKIDTTQNQPLIELYYTKEGDLPEDQWVKISNDLYSTQYSGYETAGENKSISIGAPKEDKYKDILLGNSRTIKYTLRPIPLEDVTINMNNERPTFTGNEMTASAVDGIGLTLTYGTYPLTADVDYKLVFFNNINAGEIDDADPPHVVITAMGNFTGKVDKPFTISPLPIYSDDIVASKIEITYTGKRETPKFTLTQNTGRFYTLKPGVDYDVIGYLDETKTQLMDDPFDKVGSYYVRVVGKGNYETTVNNMRDIPYSIVAREMENGLDVTFIDGTPDCVYNGEAHTPKIQVIYNHQVLNENSDYTVKYEDNINAGPAKVTVTGNGSFSGTKEINFTIRQKDIAGADMEYRDSSGSIFVDEASYEWTNEAVKPEIAIYDLSLNNAELSAADYTVTYFDDNEDGNTQRYAGKVSMTITGTGNYGGTKEFTYYIGEDISKSYVLVNGQKSLSTTYNGLTQAPKEADISVVWNSDMPQEDKDGNKRYRIAYYYYEQSSTDRFDSAHKVERDQIVNAGIYYVAVVGVPTMGTYAKSNASNSCAYTINPRSIAPSYVLVSGYDATYYYTGQAIQPRGITVEDTDLPVSGEENDPQRRTVKLISGTDYDLSYLNNVAAGKASIIVAGKGNYTGNRVAYFNILSSNADGNNTWDGSSEGTGSISNGSTTISASDIILGYDNSQYNCMMYNGYERIPTVTINGISTNEFIITASNNIRPGVATLMITGRGNNYTGTIIKNYNIKANLAAYGSIAAIEDQVYTGYQITPHVTLTCGGNVLNQGRDYTLTYLNNTNVGRATVMATATNDSYYIGTANGSFNISNKAGGMEITGYAASYTYTGYAITPDVAVMMNGRMLNRGTDYVVSYSNNTNVGTATMTVTGIGSFSGTKTINYTIEAKNIENCLTTAVNSYQYTGSTYTPSISVTDSSTGKTLVAGTDYTITYSNNTNPGTASITVTALSKNYSGSKVIPFKIVSASVSGLRTSSIKNNSVKLSWSEQDYADGYQICNSSNRVIATTSKNSYTIKGLTSCTTYRFKVRSYVENADGSVSYGGFSTAVSAKTLLNTPTLKARSTSKGRVTLTWSKVAKATGYEIYYSTKKNGVYTRLKTVSKSSSRKYVDKGLASGEKYYYTIRAYRTTNGVKTYSSYNTIKSVKVK